MSIVDINGTQINYVQIECRSGGSCEDLVMVHGLASNLAFWYLRHAQAFSEHYRITLYDLRGHGRSGITDDGYTPGNMAADLQHLLDHLGIERAHFIAHSFGGAVALNLACLDPVRLASLTIADTHIAAVRRLKKSRDWKFGKKMQPILDQHGLKIDVRESYFGYRLLSAIARLQNKNIKVSQSLEDLVRPLMMNHGKRTAKKWLTLIDTTMAGQELMGDDGLSLHSLSKLDIPILAMYGEHSQAMSTGEQLLDVWPHADFRKIREAGHFFPVTRPSEFMNNCRHFWNGELINALPRRDEDSRKKYFRSDRYYMRQGKWYFDTRESTEEGPFTDLIEAQKYLQNQIAPVRFRNAGHRDMVNGI